MKIRLTLKQIRLGVVVTLMLLSGWLGWQGGVNKASLVGSLTNKNQVIDKNNVDLGMFWQVWGKLGESYLHKEEMESQQMVWGAIKGMTASLGDPYTVFLPPEQNKASKEELDGAFEGVGIQLGFKDNRLAVIAPLSGMPAEAVGVKAGDLILHIKDENKDIDVNTTDMSLPEAVKIIRGKKGSAVELTLLHQGETETETVKIIRNTIVIKSVELKFGRVDQQGSWLDEQVACNQADCQNIAYLQLSRFGGRTAEEWDQAIVKIASHQLPLSGVVLDLRNNPGGYLLGAVKYSSEFLEIGSIVVKQQDSSGVVETYSVTDQGKLLRPPLVVLVNQGSASSSEILAGALRDHQRAKLVGVKTFAKGTIQEALDLGEGAGLHVTTAKWLLPSGSWVNETEGLTPDLEVELDREKPEIDQQLIEAIKLLLSD